VLACGDEIGKLGIWSEAEAADEVSEKERKMAGALLIAQRDVGQFPGELTTKQLYSVPGLTGGVAAGNSCVLPSGVPRSVPHVNRESCAMDAIERTQVLAKVDFDNSACPRVIGSGSRG
jgi:hypothetical protein